MSTGILRPQRVDLPVVATSVALFCLIQVLLSVLGLPFRPSPYWNNVGIYAMTWLLMFVAHAAPSVFRARPEGSLTVHIWQNELGAEYRRRLYLAAPSLLAVFLFTPAFSSFKAAMPLFTTFHWDTTLIELDRAIHGTDPWRILQVVFGYPAVTSILSIFYHVWIMIIYAGTLFFAIYQSNVELRRRYFVSFFLCWFILGMVTAAAFASYGPCFVGPLQGNSYFDEQMAYLTAANEVWPVMTLKVQAILIDWHHLGEDGLGRGISAFPSMHISLALLFYLAMRHVSQASGRIFGIFFLIIFVGSIHLGYHYAVDAYASIIGTLLIWFAVGKAFGLKSHKWSRVQPAALRSEAA